MSKGRKTHQYSLSFKVSGKEKATFAARCARAGMTQSEMLERLVFGRMPDEQPLIEVARTHISLTHDLRARAAAGAPIDDALLHKLLDATRELITALRVNLEQ